MSKNTKRKKRYGWLGLGVLLFFSNPVLSNKLLQLWELKTITPAQIKEPYDLGIILSGFSSNRGYRPNSDAFFYFAGRSSNRLTQALELYRSGKIRKLLLCGGNSSIIGNKVSESEMTRQFLIKLGIPAADIFVEPNAKNTHESAVNCRQLFNDFPEEDKEQILLLTSAFHMRRSKACFEKEGLLFTPFSVDFYQSSAPFTGNSFLPSSGSLEIWEIITKEWVGTVAYKIKGYM